MRSVARSLAAVAVLALLVSPVWGGRRRCHEPGVRRLFRDYTAPDPGTSTPGSIMFGISGIPETMPEEGDMLGGCL